MFGGEVIRPFAQVLIFGVAIGTFSSIFVAAPALYWIERRWPSKSKSSRKPSTPARPRVGTTV
jgi:preprotein translocase subunit SecF